MKKSLIFRITMIVVIMISCKSNSEVNLITPSANCRIIKSVNESKSSNDTFIETSTTDYQYDKNGNLTKKSLVIDGKTKAYYVQDETYSYNTEGYLIEQTFVGIIDEPNIPVKKTSSNSKFTYTNGRLSVIEKSNINLQGKVSIENTKYLYDANGVLTSQVRTNSVGTTFTSSYNSKGELTDYIIKTNTETTKPYTLQNGLVIKDMGKGYYLNYAYNAQRQMVKSEVYNNNKLNSYYTIEYDNSLFSEITIPKFKGFPSIKLEMGSWGCLRNFSISQNQVTELWKN
jgi:hypothetical protein